MEQAYPVPTAVKSTIAGRKFYWHAPQNVITSDDEKALRSSLDDGPATMTACAKKEWIFLSVYFSTE